MLLFIVRNSRRRTACLLQGIPRRNRKAPRRQRSVGILPYKTHVKSTVALGSRKIGSEPPFILAEDGTLLRNKVRIRERWVEVLHDVKQENAYS